MMQLFGSDSIVVSATLLVLLLCSVATWSIVVYKLRQRSRNGKLNRAFAQQFWDSPDWKSAERMSEQHEGQLASLARAAFREEGGNSRDVGRIASWASCADLRLRNTLGVSGRYASPYSCRMRSRTAAIASSATRTESVRM